MTANALPLTDQLASAVHAHLCEHLWDGPPVTLPSGDDGVLHRTLDVEETAAAGGGEFDIILRGQAGDLYDVHLAVAVTARDNTTRP